MEDAGAVVPLSHVRQKHDYDCGIACVQMILGAAEYPTETLVELMGGIKSIWTIDLACLLAKIAPDFKLDFHTFRAGADPDYATTPYYTKTFISDRDRVTRLFQSVSDRHPTLTINIGPQSLTDFTKALSRNVCALVLVDAHRLRCRHCHNNLLTSLLGRMKTSKAYSGHYVLVVRVEKDAVRYWDPSQAQAECEMDLKEFYAASVAEGTDGDKIFIRKRGNDDNQQIHEKAR